MIKQLQSFIEDESGATALEYGFIAALASIAGLIGFQALGQSVDGMFQDVLGKILGADTK